MKIRKIGIFLIPIIISLLACSCLINEQDMNKTNKRYPGSVNSMEEIPKNFHTLITNGNQRYVAFKFLVSYGHVSIPTGCYYEESSDGKQWNYKENKMIDILSGTVTFEELNK